MDSLLEVRNLKVEYTLPAGAVVPAVRGVDFEIEAGTAVGVLGESGSGKSTLAASIGGLLAPGAKLSSGSVMFRGRNLVGLAERELRGIRGAEISLIHQEPALALNPVLRVGRQVADIVRAHRMDADADQEAHAVLELVGLSGSDVFRAYPHQLSGGQRQRVSIAQAIVCRPSLVIADEPTSALDSTTQASIIDLLKQLRRELGMALLLVSQDPAVLGALCDRVLVMYAGQIVEQGTMVEVYRDSLHPYTRGLLSLLNGRAGSHNGRLPFIAGAPPEVDELAPGCSFVPRCSERLPACGEREPEEVLRGERRVRCFKYGG